jgi:hypothetical protein
MKNEYVIWGIAPNTTEEDILFTEAQSIQEAKKVVDILTTKHNCKNCRIQVIHFSKPLDFLSIINN